MVLFADVCKTEQINMQHSQYTFLFFKTQEGVDFFTLQEVMNCEPSFSHEIWVLNGVTLFRAKKGDSVVTV